MLQHNGDCIPAPSHLQCHQETSFQWLWHEKFRATNTGIPFHKCGFTWFCGQTDCG